MVRFKFFINKEKQEKYFNLMSSKGYIFEKYFMGFCTFSCDDKDKWEYKITYKNEEKPNRAILVNQNGPWTFYKREKKLGKLEYNDNMKIWLSFFRNELHLFSFFAVIISLLSIISFSYYNINYHVRSIVIGSILGALGLFLIAEAIMALVNVVKYYQIVKGEEDNGNESSEV